MPRLTSKEQVVQLIGTLPPADEHARRIAAERQRILTKPLGSLGRLEELALWLCGWQGMARPRLDHCQAIVFAGNHGIAARGVSAFPADVTEQMVANFQIGGAAINQLCESVGARLNVHAIELERPTADFTRAPAMTWEECLAAMNSGIGSVDSEADILILGEMGIGNTTVAAAICSGLFGEDPGNWVGRGTGIDDRTLALKAEIIRAATVRHQQALHDPLDVLTILGGREQAAIFGATLEARMRHVPVILDGFVCTAAAAPLACLASGSLDHCLIGHVSAEPGHQRLLKALGKTALLDLDMRLGEASGAAVALAVLRCAVATHVGMSTFAEAGVDERHDA